MVKTFLILSTLIASLNSQAIDGVITVLEAPIFSTPDKLTKVVQYARKGTTLFIHPQEAFRDRYKDVEGLETDSYPLFKDDDLLLGDKDLYIPKADSDFYKTITKSGNVGYILKEHVFLQYKDRRELSQALRDHDNTDYRITEPLPEGYPLKTKGGYRGQFTFSLGQPNFKPYSYRQKIIDSSFDFIKEVNFVWSKNSESYINKRFFFGLVGGVHLSQINYILETQSSQEENLRLQLGPFASYDTYKSDKYILNISTSLQFVLYDSMEITLTNSATEESETRSYSNLLSVTPNIGSTFIAKKSFFIFDTIAGFNMKFLAPKTYTANDSAKLYGLWQDRGSTDSYEQDFKMELTYFLGVQSNY